MMMKGYYYSSLLLFLILFIPFLTSFNFFFPFLFFSLKKQIVFFEPTSAPKSIKIFKAFSNLHELKSFHQFMYASPNIRELIEMSKYLQSSYPTLHSPSVLPSSKSTSETYHLFPNLSGN